jgi:DNA-directed RNA polymerase
MKISLAKSAEALRWRGYYQLLHLWKNAVRHLHALMEAHADENKHFGRR